ncbi:MAG TPA: hypothetical protein VMP11_20465 [Verrucomicrobiae bacterium]|nr:hypothetical protein [Verrucomicrobiae bacterium]
MNWMTKVAILFGRKKFEEFAQANPELPDDALAVANTLDTHSVRGAVALILGSLAHAADNVLRGTETIDQLATHVLLILAGLCIIWVRHQFPIQHVLDYVEIRADGDAPSGGPLTVQILIGGALQGQVFSLDSASNYSGLIAVSGSGLIVNANTTVAVKLVSGSQASDVTVTLHYQKVIL